MSKKLISFFLSELETVRIHCTGPQCRGVIELPTSQLPTLANGSIGCAACGTLLNIDHGPLIAFGRQVAALKNSGLKLEFILPSDDQK